MEYDNIQEGGVFVNYVLEAESIQREGYFALWSDQFRSYVYGDTEDEAVDALRSAASAIMGHFSTREELEEFLTSRKVAHWFSDSVPITSLERANAPIR